MSTEFAGAIVDLDGTVWRGEDLIDGAIDGIDVLREAGITVAFVSNGTDIDRDAFDDRLDELGLPTDIEIITAASATAEHCAAEHPDAEAFVIGQQPIAAELEAVGISATDLPTPADSNDGGDREAVDTGPADVLVAGREPDLSEGLLDEVLTAFDADTEFVATNTDRTHPIGENRIIPGAGATIGAIEGMTGVEPTVVGKPEARMAETATESMGIDPADCLVIGDRLETDILMGNNAGMTTVLVLTGASSEADIDDSGIEPDHVIDSLADIESVLE
jgi:HAD superfamily hydrolase (TIGR01450 family)